MKAYYKRIIPLILSLLFLGCILFPTSAIASGENEPSIYRFPAGEKVQQAPDDPPPELSPEEQKLDTQLLQLVKPELIPEGQPVNNAIEMLKRSGALSTKSIAGREEYIVNVYVEMNSNTDFGALDPIVARIMNSSKKYHLAVAEVEVDKLMDLAAMDGVKSIRFVTPPICRAGAVESEGDTLLRANLARAASGADGTGVKIGIISDGATHYASSVASGDLPAGVTILSAGSGDEGTAMMEIVHDVAPGAQLFFHDCGDNVLDFNAAIDELVAAGCTIVCDDIGWIAEPFFEDGIVASHVKGLIAQNHILYVSSAGNAAYSHYQGAYGNDGTGRHDFSGGTDPTYKDLYVHLETGHPIYIVLQWNDAFDHSSNNYDLYLGAVNRSSIWATSTTIQNGSQDPLELIAINPSSTRDAAVWVSSNGNPLPRTLEIYIYGDGYSDNYNNNITQADSIFGHPAVPGAVACGAIDANSADGADYNKIEYFSSQGPVTLVDGSTRQKPELCGADGTHVTGAGGFPSPFYGTSAAAPHVAAVAALLWSEFPAATPAQIRQVLTESSVDYGVSGFDSIYGNGRIDALNAVQDTCTVSFDSKGGSDVEAVTALRHCTIAEPTAPIKPDRLFKGWFREPSYLTEWNFSTDVVTNNITLYAKWTSGTTCDVAFDSQGGSPVDSITAEYDSTIVTPPPPTREGYFFGGWYREPACINEWDFSSDRVTADIALYARWYVFPGSGDSDDPYRIASAQDLARLAELVNAGDEAYRQAYYSLGNDIDLSAVPNWVSIGNIPANAFTGTFDGNNHTIAGLMQNASESNGACGGLFGYVSGGTVENCTVTNCAVLASVLSSSATNPAYAGGIVGYLSNDGSIMNCAVSGSVGAAANSNSAAKYAGGIAGYVDHSTIGDCASSARVTSNGPGNSSAYSYAGGIVGYAQGGSVLNDCSSSGRIETKLNIAYALYGGIAGYLENSTVRGCSNTGSVYATSLQNHSYAGGIAGIAQYCTIETSWNTGSISASASVGGIAGMMSVTTVERCYNAGNVSSNEYFSNRAGGIAGEANSTSAISNCYSTGAVSASAGEAFSCAEGGIVGNAANTTINNCYSIGSFSLPETNKGYIGGIAGNNLSSAPISNCYFLDRTPHGAGLGTDAGTAVSVEQLSVQDTFAGFDFSGTWTMAGNTKYPYPELAGMDYAGAIVENTSEYAGGSGLPTDPYRISTKSQLDNIRKHSDAYFVLVSDINFTTADFAPGGEFYNDGRGFIPIGGPFNGQLDGDGHAIRGLVSNTMVDRGEAYGGLFSSICCGTVKDLSLLDCDISARITSDTIRSCYSGGISGHIWDGTIENCCFSGSVSATTYYVGDPTYAGGIAGFQHGGTINGCYNNGDIAANTAGGIVGYAEKDNLVSDCYNTGTITTRIAPNGAKGGGIAGHVKDNCSISSCYNAGSVNMPSGYTGGIAGKVENNQNNLVNNCYFLEGTATSGIMSGIGTALKLSDAQMRQQENYTGFDFTGIWMMGGNGTYSFPELRAIPQACIVIYNSKGGSAVDTVTVRYNGRISEPSPPTLSHKTFAGWYTDSSCSEGNEWNFTTGAVTSDITLYAKWKMEVHIVHFNSCGGSAVPDKSADYNTRISAPDAPTWPGRTFAGWYKDSGYSDDWNFTNDVVVAETMLYARWTVPVHFDSKGGSRVGDIVATVGLKIAPPTNPVLSHFTFAGWFSDSTCSTPWVFTVNTVHQEITLYAKWTLSSLPPPSPVAGSASYNSVKLTWNAVANASGYEVYRAVSATGAYSLAGTSASASFTNTGLTTGTTYYYKVRAYRASGSTKLYSAYSSVVSAKPVPAAPASPKAAPSTYSSVKVSWGAVAGITKYELYRSTSSGGTYSVVAATTALSYTNTSVSTGTTYYYKVRAYRLVGSTKVYGPYTSIVTAKPTLAAPASPKAAPASYNSIKVSWGAVAGATKYELCRSTSSGGIYSVVAATTARSYTNTSVNTDTPYYYKVRAYRLVAGKKVYGPYSAIVTAKTALAAPASPKAAPASYNSIKVSWKAVAGVTKYELYRSTSSSGTYTLLTATTARGYTNTSVNTGTTYYYKVRAYRLVAGKKIYGPYSAIATAKTVLAAPTSPKAARASSASIKVSWKKVAGATEYEVWRSVSSSGTYSLITTAGSIYYTNTGLTAGKYYYYRVRAYRLVGSTKVYSPFTKVVYTKP